MYYPNFYPEFTEVIELYVISEKLSLGLNFSTPSRELPVLNLRGLWNMHTRFLIEKKRMLMIEMYPKTDGF